MKKVFNIVIRLLFIIAVPIFLISVSIGIVVNTKWVYEAGFKKYDIVDVTCITMPEQDNAATGIINYINNSDEYINVWIMRGGQEYQLFSEDQKEIIHMKDVKALFRLDYTVLVCSFIFVAAYISIMLWRKDLKSLAWGLIGGGGLTLGLMIVMGLGILTGFFDTLFIKFHEIAFTNMDWLLDPNMDVLIMMFPDGFWQDVVSYIGMLSSVFAVVIGALGGLYIWKTKWKETVEL